MELREFISTVLVEIVRGVEDAQSRIKDSKATINPLGLQTQIALEQNEGSPEFSEVEFEVGVRADKKGGAGGGIGVQLAVFSVGGDRKSLESESHINKLRFSVPVHLPPGDVLKLGPD